MPKVRQLTESGRIADEKKRLTNIYRNKAQANGISYMSSMATGHEAVGMLRDKDTLNVMWRKKDLNLSSY